MNGLEAVKPGTAGSARAAAIEAAPGLAVAKLELWRGDYCVCVGLDAAAAPGQVLHLRGANGAGKTSLIRVLAGLSLPESGELRLWGEPARGRMTAYRAAICYVGHSDGIKRELTPEENLRLSACLVLDPSRRTPAEALERVGLAEHAGRPCAEMSAGQRRRTALARLLMSNAPVWLLDEPLVSLDRSGAGLVADLMHEHVAAGGIAVLATHQPVDLTGIDVVEVDLPQGGGSW